ncbi:uncharacterized protein CG43867 isoform X4 [Lepeophtheirus salmonis]|uniref:uncharacterized protein CG43867 isoform X4 n=1 Tax=Lepeophtheirus salmonis TaxID=72036 RepID=UPI001AE1D5A4|nr:uncharacterized protein CG43867-like isoform X2 [Lepeophtheirus salmonis]
MPTPPRSTESFKSKKTTSSSTTNHRSNGGGGTATTASKFNSPRGSSKTPKKEASTPHGGSLPRSPISTSSSRPLYRRSSSSNRFMSRSHEERNLAGLQNSSRKPLGGPPAVEIKKKLLNNNNNNNGKSQVRVMEQRLNEVDWSPNASSNSIHDPKDCLIRSLESEVEQQKLLRLTDAKQVEAKAARIKDWVTNKLRELEEQNDHLKVQNIHCNEQMELLHNRLEQLQVLSASTKSRQTTSITSIEESSSKKSTEDQPIPTPRTAHPRSNRPESESILLPNNGVTSEGGGVLGVTDVLSRHQSLHMSVAPIKKLSSKKIKHHIMSEENHDYSEIYTPSNEEKVPRAWVDSTCTEISDETPSSSGGRTGSGDSGLTGLSLPPPRPLHRFPSWEDRIYQVASEGLTVNSEAKMNFQRGAFGCDINVPVYATVKGRASQIRSIPFTGDSSDSSDNEDGGDTGRGTTASSTSGEISLPSPRMTTTTNSTSLYKHQHNTLTVHSHVPTNKTFVSSGKLDTSFDSDLSNDYAIPPDASGGVNSHMSTLERDSPRREKSLEKSGYLTKLGGKIKSWKRRYFVLKSGALSYWKSQHDTHRKPQGLISLDESCRVSRNQGSNTFEIATGSKTYYLTADNQPVMEDWVRVLQNVIQRNALQLLILEGQKPTLEGWLKKVKHGHAKKCWCVLIGKIFIYFRTPNDQHPVGQINMRDSRVEEVENISDSDSDEVASPNEPCTIGIFPNLVNQGPTYLIFANKTEKEDWLYQLTVVSGGDPKAGTDFEQLIQKLMEEDGDYNSVVWRHPLMVYSKEHIHSPLTTFTSETLVDEALKLFKSLQLFMTVVMDSAGIDYHVVLAANAIQHCIDVPELHQELLCALIKQTSRHCASSSKAHQGMQSFLMNASQLFSCESNGGSGGTQPKVLATPSGPPVPSLAEATCGSSISNLSSSSSNSSSSKNPANCVFIQGWMLLALTVSIFVPKSRKLLWFLRAHLNKNKDQKTETGKYAAYCSRALERSVVNGPRHCKPSRMEVLSILLKNPDHHSLPHAVPVHFLNETYRVVGFDGSTTIAEFLRELNNDIGCRSVELNGFTIFSDDPFEKDIDHALHMDDKVCDVISRWETALREKGMGKFENKKVIRFVYKNRLFWRKNISGEVDKERLLFCYQVSRQIVQGKFPLNKELAFEIAALMSQIHYGDFEKGSSKCGHSKEALERFFPGRYLSEEEEDFSSMETRLVDKWHSLSGKNSHDCVRIILNCTRKWQFFGAALFSVKMVNEDVPMSIWMSINEEGISILDHSTMQLTSRYPYDSIVTFGGCQEDFMIVINQDADLHPRRCSQESQGSNAKLLFQTEKAIILEITLLVADYMNAIGKQAGPGLMPSTPKLMARHAVSSSGANSRMSNRGRLTSAPNTPHMMHKNHPSESCLSSNTNTLTPELSRSKKRQQLDSGVA